MDKTCALVAPVKDPRVLQENLLRSPEIDGFCELLLKHDYPSASAAYNAAITEASADLLVFAHTDVFFPMGWAERLSKTVCRLEQSDPNWGVLGLCGLSLEKRVVGHVYSTGSGRVFGNESEDLVETRSVDEMVIITRRSSGLRFDGALPGFHLYGTDICYEALQRGMKSYVCSNFCIHNSCGIASLPWNFWRPYLFLRKKWRSYLPIRTCCATITWGYGFVIREILRHARGKVFPSRVSHRCSDVMRLAEEIEELHCRQGRDIHSGKN